MKNSFYKILILSVVLLFISVQANAQFASSKKKGKNLIVAIGGGGSALDGGYSLIGGNVMLELRKPIASFASNFTVSLNLASSAVFGSAKERGKDAEFAFVPTGIATININAYSQSSRIAKNMLGGFFGVGLIVLPSKTIEKTKPGGEKVNVSTGMFGPAVVFGPRFRIGKTYMDLRVYGGTTIGETELVYGGFNIMFTLGMGKKKRVGMR